MYLTAKPIVDPPRGPLDRKLDFGRGMYLTKDYGLAGKWAEAYSRRRKNKDDVFVNVYEFDCENAERKLNVKKFTDPDREWFGFVIDCRTGRKRYDNTDIFAGPAADDDVYKVIFEYESGNLDFSRAVEKLKFYKLADQWVFVTDRAQDYLTFMRREEIVRKRTTMPEREFQCILMDIAENLVGMIMAKFNWPEKKALKYFYNSKLYGLLEREETKVWQFSVSLLFDAFEGEYDTGVLQLPV